MATATDPGMPILAAESLVKRFPGVVALKDVSFDLRPAEIHALCGENGAGKSTLIKILGGLHPYGSYEGRILIGGEEAHFSGTRDAEAVGISVIYQELALVPEMTVAENVFLGSEPRRLGGLFIDSQTMYRRAKELLDQFGLHIDPAARVTDLSVGHQQLVEIAKALGKRSRVLILDEPTAALTGQEVEVLLNILRDLRRRGIACIYISHKLDEVFAISDRITVLRDGSSVCTMPTAETDKHAIIRQMVGREIADLFPRRATTPGAVKLLVNDLSVAGARGGTPVLSDISFEVRGGEVLGIGGLMGAGRSELLLHLFGAFGHRTAGTVELDGKPLSSNTPQESIRRGLVMVSEDRKRHGLVLDQSIEFNLSLSSLGSLTHVGLIDGAAEHTRNRGLFDSLRIKAPSMRIPVGKLSGGNQQKVVLGKALMTEPKVIFLDEPTRGIDVGAKIEVYELINRITEAGHAVVLVSSELPELLGMSDRILMLADGRVGGIFSRSEATQERLLAAAMGRASAA
jgi:D-xylose transport system ATP-binding protein